MPIYDRVTHHDYLMYQKGWKKLPSSFSRFVAIDDSWRAPSLSYDSYNPDPSIFIHHHTCPNKPAGFAYVTHPRDMPEGYINHRTPECVDVRTFYHDDRCPHSHYQRTLAMFRAFLADEGRPAYVGREWDDTDHRGNVRHVQVEHCPLCDDANQNQCAFGYCNHAKPFHSAVTILMKKDPRYERRPECLPEEGTLGCHWADWNVCMERGPQWSMLTYEGCVLGEYERNMYDDSDFIAVVWDEVTQSVRHTEWGTTRFACSSGCVVDATDETKQKAYEYCITWATEQTLTASIHASDRLQAGKEIQVVKAVRRAKDPRNNVPKNMCGIIMAVQEGQYGMRVQFKDSDIDTALPGEEWRHYHWVAAENVEVCNPANYVISMEEARARGLETANLIRSGNRWRMIGYVGAAGIACLL